MNIPYADVIEIQVKKEDKCRWTVTCKTVQDTYCETLHSKGERDKLLSLLAPYFSLQELGQHFGLSRERVRQLAIKHGIAERATDLGYRQACEHKEEIHSLLLQGLTIRDITAHLLLTYRGVYRLVREEKWSRRKIPKHHGKPLAEYIGEVHGNWTIIGISDRRSYDNRPYLICQCTCGSIREVLQVNLFRGVTRACGCGRATNGSMTKEQLEARTKEWLGKRINKLTVVGPYVWGRGVTCRCDCGERRIIHFTKIKFFKSCGKCTQQGDVPNGKDE